MRSLLKAVLFTTLAWAAPAVLTAQETINYASVSGRVADSTGALIRAADVVARQVETNLTTKTVSDQDGRFRFPYLTVGRYEFTVSRPGFARFSRTLTLTVGAAFDLPVTLALAGVDTSVTVTAD